MKRWNNLLTIGCISCLLVSPLSTYVYAQEATTGQELYAPIVVDDENFSTGLSTDWSCLYFGSYPMAEVVEGEFTAVDDYAVNEGDVITDADLYAALEAATWEDDETEIDGVRYLRMNAYDAVTWATDRIQHYRWENPDEYHYFRYEPLKWRVIALEDGKATLLTDKLYDSEPYNLVEGPVNWGTSTLRSWLNGYPAQANTAGITFEGMGFIDRAFNEEERAALVETNVVNNPNFYYGTDCGEETVDYAFLLSNEEVFASQTALDYGFYPNNGKDDAAKRFKTTTYAKCRGAWWSSVESYKGNTFWFMRNSGYTPESATYICDFGYVYNRGTAATCDDAGLLFAICIDLEKADYEIADHVTSYDILQEPEEKGEDRQQRSKIVNPVFTPDENMPGGKHATYSMVSLGSYPQSEVVRQPQDGTSLSIVNPDLYAALEAATWEGNEAEVDGHRFLKVEEDGTVRYFLYQEMIWRVLQVDNGTALLAAHYAIDCEPFNEEQKEVSWEDCTLRSYLNGYEADANVSGIDYSAPEDNFLDMAFSEGEQEAILNYPVRNQNNYYFGMDSGADTVDKVFLLAESEIFIYDSSVVHGFSPRDEVGDMARRFIPTDYAVWKGSWRSPREKNFGNVFWWTRTTGYDHSNAVYVDESGAIFNRGILVTCADASLIPALVLDLDSTAYEYRGTFTTPLPPVL